MIEFGEEVHKRLELARESPELEVGNIDFDFSNKAVLRSLFKNIGPYFARVETQVANNVKQVRAILPNELEGEGEEFLNIWGPHELKHGEAWNQLLRHLDLSTYELPDDEINPKFEALGFITKKVPKLARIVYFYYAVTGAKHELQTIGGYQSNVSILRDKDEIPLIRTMFKPILRNEGVHYPYYYEVAKDLKDQMSRVERRLARWLLIKFYNPVGANTKQDQIDFGYMARDLGGDRLEDLSKPVQEIAQELLVISGEELEPFVAKRIKDCIEMAREERLAA